jgi:pantetheine-phosphate adenylyltransferase
MPKIGFYAGSFDPLTFGHIDVIRAALRVVDTLVIAVGAHANKAATFTAQERIALLQHSMDDLCTQDASLKGRMRTTTFEGLTTDAAASYGASVIVRGLRDGTDFDYEMQLAAMNAMLKPDITTIFLPASAATRAISATLVRQIARMGGDLQAFVPAHVADQLRKKYANL